MYCSFLVGAVGNSVGAGGSNSANSNNTGAASSSSGTSGSTSTTPTTTNATNSSWRCESQGPSPSTCNADGENINTRSGATTPLSRTTTPHSRAQTPRSGATTPLSDIICRSPSPRLCHARSWLWFNVCVVHYSVVPDNSTLFRTLEWDWVILKDLWRGKNQSIVLQ